MSAKEKLDYIVVTPAYNEVSNIELTIQSMVSQTLLPKLWVVIDDGSEDATWEIMESASQKYPWIIPHHRIKEQKQDEDGLLVASEAKAFLKGYELANEIYPDVDFIVKLDADLKFGPDFFSKILNEFDNNLKLGVAGGVIYEFKGTKLVRERVSTAHVRGATKVYRRDCYESIQGVRPVFGWDVIDEVLARVNGWEVCSFEDIPLIHLRPTASREGRFSGWARNGYMAYYIGMTPLRIFLRVLFRLVVARDAVQCFGLAHGYFSNYFRRAERLPDREIRKLVRQHQWVTAKQSLSD
jgi:glycosyltransferase involved in cell wall biosynthesis